MTMMHHLNLQSLTSNILAPTHPLVFVLCEQGKQKSQCKECGGSRCRCDADEMQMMQSLNLQPLTSKSQDSQKSMCFKHAASSSNRHTHTRTRRQEDSKSHFPALNQRGQALPSPTRYLGAWIQHHYKQQLIINRTSSEATCELERYRLRRAWFPIPASSCVRWHCRPTRCPSGCRILPLTFLGHQPASSHSDARIRYLERWRLGCPCTLCNTCRELRTAQACNFDA